MAVCRRNVPVQRKVNDWLIKDSFNVTSQGGEDGVIERVFDVIGEHEAAVGARPESRWCVEFGAWDGKHLSNTWKLLHEENWHGVLIEADKPRCDQMARMYANHPRVQCINAFVSFDGPMSLDAILARANAPSNLDLISIDIDGADYHIWDSLRSIHPKVVVIEFNPSIPNNVVFIQDKDMSVYHGSSLAALIELGKAKGYELVSTTTFNGIFVQHQYYPLFHMPDNSIDTMHDVPMPTEFFQLYDGTLKITGVKKLLWKKQPINEKDIQVLSAAQRRFPFIPPDIEREMANADALFLDAQKDSANRGAVARHFVELVQRWSVHCSYPNEDIRRFAGYALSLGRGDAAVAAALLAFYEQTADVHFKANSPQHAIQWLKQALYLPSVQENLVHKAHVMTRLGEAYLRQHRYDKAEFWLQMSMALEGHDKTTLKTLAKLYTKLGHTDAQRRIVDELRALNTD